MTARAALIQDDEQIDDDFEQHDDCQFDEHDSELEPISETLLIDETEGDEGQFLGVTLRVMSASETPSEDDWLRRSLFRTTCTSGGKACSVIVDGGSVKNFVSQDMVDKLGLRVERLDRPYKIAWVNGVSRCL